MATLLMVTGAAAAVWSNQDLTAMEALRRASLCALDVEMD